MNVVVVTSSYPLHPDDSAAAAGLFVRDFVLEMARQGHDVRVLTQRRAGPRQSDPSVRVVDYPWLGDRPLSALRLSRPLDLAGIVSVVTSGLWALKALVREDPPDRIIAMWAVPAGLLAGWVGFRLRVPYRVWVLGSDLWTYGSHPLTRPVVRRVLRSAERVFADGRRLAGDAERMSGVPCGFLPSSRELPSGNRRPGELDPRRKNFVFVGRFHPNKGPDRLVAAIAELGRQERADMRFFLFGDGPSRASIQSRIDSLGLDGCVSLMGYSDRLRTAAFLEHAHALVVPSRIESIPVVLSDAAQARCPAVVTDVGDMGLIVREYGSGLVVESNNQAILEGIRRMAGLTRGSFSQACERMAKAFSLSKSVATMLG